MKTIVVLGAGITGMTAANELRKKHGAAARILLLEKGQQAGGLLIGSELGGYNLDNGCYVYSFDTLVTKRYPQLFREAVFTWRIWLNGRLIPYPPNYQSILKPQALGIKLQAMAGMLGGRFWSQIAAPQTAQKWLEYALGKKMIELTHLDVYLNKLQGIDAAEIHPYLCNSRLDSLKQPLWDIFKRQFLSRFGAPPPQSTRIMSCYPMGGTIALAKQALAECVANNIEIVYNTRLNSISRQDGQYLVQGEELELQANQIYSTIPLAELIPLLPSDAKLQSFPTPRYTTLQVAKFLVSNTTQSGAYYVLYSFEAKHLWKRATCIKQTEQAYTVVVEANLPESCDAAQQKELMAKIRNDLTGEIGLFRREDILAEEMRSVPFAYPIIDTHHWEQILELQNYLEQHYGLCLLGRQGRHDYLSSNQTMEQTIKRISSAT